ncbi:MAG TPA: amidophosphoribosyltransferase [Candidatus Bathyarchaeia archaeon]|nr:amidophosphoribosyltransferase [Candidatus Bathyarchaeia archaeon]
MDDYLKMWCGVFGAIDFTGNNIFPYLYWGMRAQNHRGHQSHGFLTFNGDFNVSRGLGLIPKLREKELQRWLDQLPGSLGIANVRYTTSGGSDEEALIRGTQPVTAEHGRHKIGISFNGNVVNTVQLTKEIRLAVPNFLYDCDVELISRKLSIELKKHNDLVSSVRACMQEIEGAFSVVGITQDGDLFAFKDPYGIRPLCSGCSQHPKMCAFSSETVGLDINNIEYSFELNPGEFVLATKDEFQREQLVASGKKALCAFEFAYFARPDSRLNGKYVYEVRESFGRNLGKEHPDIVRKCDMIISLPETSDDAAFGLHEETGLRWERAIRRHRYVSERAFILLPQERYATVDKKINILDHKFKDKKIIVVDDSIVRGDTTRVVVEKLRKKGAKEIHMFITFPRIIGPCPYGIDMATYSELIGSTRDPEEIAKEIGADSVNYQSLEGFVKATGMTRDELCFGCTTGNYPTPLANKLAAKMREQFERGYKEIGRLYELAELVEKSPTQ